MDYSEVYCIAMGASLCPEDFSVLIISFPVLHPCHKLAYFCKVSWSPTWINMAHEIVQAEYEHKYKNMLIEREEENKVEEVPPSVSVCQSVTWSLF